MADLLGHQHSQSELQSNEEPLVAVVIPARNEEEFIARCIDSLQRQSHSNLQILVVDGESEDRTRQIVTTLAEHDPRIELLVNPDRVIPKGMNLAVEHARSEWLVRIDAHATIPPNYIELALSHLMSGKWGGVGGRKDGVGQTSAGRAIATAMASRFGVGNSIYHHGTEIQTVEHIPFGSYPMCVIREVGGWDENLRVNQDFEFDHRVQQAGYELLFDPELRIDWHCRQSIWDFFQQYRRYGRGKTDVARLHPISVRPRHLAAPSLLLSLLAAAVVAPFRPRFAVAAVAPYVMALTIASRTERGSLDDRASQLRLPAAFAAMHIGWAIGFFEGWGRQFIDALSTSDGG